MKIISIIPARGGSKRLPGKNIMDLCKKPLIAYSIEASLDSGIVNRTIVSTDDNKIAEISKKYGAEVFIRPDELAQDTSSTYDVIENVIKKLNEDNYFPDVIVLLQPTSPLRNKSHIKNAVEKYNSCGKKTLVSFKKSNPIWNVSIENKKIKPILGWEFLRKRKQDLPEFYEPNGAIYISTPDFIIKNRNFFCEDMEMFEMSAEESIDIDTKLDFKQAEFILNENGKERIQ